MHANARTNEHVYDNAKARRRQHQHSQLPHREHALLLSPSKEPCDTPAAQKDSLSTTAGGRQSASLHCSILPSDLTRMSDHFSCPQLAGLAAHQLRTNHTPLLCRAMRVLFLGGQHHCARGVHSYM
jgi:hypothetical protein